MRKSKLFFLIKIIGVAVTVCFILGAFISFSFGMTDKPSEMDCSDKPSPFQYKDGETTNQCGFPGGVAALTYILYIFLIIFEIAPIPILIFLKKKRWTLLSFILSLVVPILLGFVLYYQAVAIDEGTAYCEATFETAERSCDSMIFVTSPLLTAFGCVSGLIVPVLMFYVRCLKGNFEKEEKDYNGDEMKEEKKKKKEEKKKEEKKKNDPYANTPNNNNDIQFGNSSNNDFQFGSNTNNDFQFGSNTNNDFQATQFTPQSNNHNDDMIDFGAIAHDNY